MPIDVAYVSTLVPELILVLAAVGVFLGGTWCSSRLVWMLASLVAVGLSAISWLQAPLLPADGSAGPLMQDGLAHLLRGASLGLGALLILFASQSRQSRVLPEIMGGLLLVTAGLMLVCCAGDLAVLFIGLELISIPTYMLLFVGRPGRNSDEGAAKYFYLSILSSAILLYGLATLYGLSGDTRLAAIQSGLASSQHGPFQALFPVAVLMILCGLCFKIAAAPFHFYAPDVYQATTSLNAALLAVVPKIAGVVGLVRILILAVPHTSAVAWQVVVVLAIVTMTFANVAALWQTHVRRLMAYSSVAHAGYLLVGLAASLAAASGSEQVRQAVAAMVFYVVAYGLATIGVFAGLAYLSDDDQTFATLDELAGVGRKRPLIGAVIATCLFSLSGIPPLAGFLGKFALFRSALALGLPGPDQFNPWFVTLAIVGALNAAIAAAYYLRMIAALYFATPSDESLLANVTGNHGAGLAAVLSGSLVVVLGIFAGGLMTVAQTSADRLPWMVEAPAEEPNSETPASLTVSLLSSDPSSAP